MSKKQTEGWAVRTISAAGREAWHYVGSTQQLYKTRAGAANKADRLPNYWGNRTIMKATIFYEPDQ